MRSVARSQSWIFALALLGVSAASVAEVVVTRDSVAKYVNIRVAPSANSEAIGKLHRGKQVELVGSVPRWHEVIIADGRKGFVSSVWTKVVMAPPVADDPEPVAEQGPVAVAAETSDVEVSQEVEAVEPVVSGDEPAVADAPTEPSAGDEPAGPHALADVEGTPDYLIKFTEAMKAGDSRIVDDGTNVGIGTSEPQQALDVNGNVQIYNQSSNLVVLSLRQASGKTGYITHNIAGTLTLGAGSEDRITVDRNGNVGIGTNRPRHQLEMASGAYVTAGGVWTNASSRDLKENIAELALEEALTALRGLKPVQFNYKQDANDRYAGFIAEDVPDLVASIDRRGLSSMDIVAVLTTVVQAQQRRLDELEARLEVK